MEKKQYWQKQRCCCCKIVSLLQKRACVTLSPDVVLLGFVTMSYFETLVAVRCGHQTTWLCNMGQSPSCYHQTRHI